MTLFNRLETQIFRSLASIRFELFLPRESKTPLFLDPTELRNAKAVSFRNLIEVGALIVALVCFSNQALARFIQEDPSGVAAGTNLYTYVDGKPLTLADPLGLQSRGVPQPGGPGAQYRWPSLGPSRAEVVGPYSTASQGRVNEVSASRC